MLKNLVMSDFCSTFARFFDYKPVLVREPKN